MEIVDDCPVSEEDWRKAAARKNCSAYASQCDKPDKFVYHCVINTFVNQTLEVCAYGKEILLGKNKFRMLKSSGQLGVIGIYHTIYSNLGHRFRKPL